MSESNFIREEHPFEHAEYTEEKIKNFLKRFFDNDPLLLKYKQDNNPCLEMKSRSSGFLTKMSAGEDYIVNIVSFDKEGILTFEVFADEKEKEKGDKKKTLVKIKGEALKEIK